jgi:integrase
MKKFLDINEIRTLLALSRSSPRDFALFHLSASTGLRISDVLSTKISTVIDNDGEIVRVVTIRMRKTKFIISRVLRDDCRNAVKSFLASREDINPYLFPAMVNQHVISDDGHLCRMSAHRMYKNYLYQMYSESELVGVSTHTLRRSMGKIISQAAGRIEPASKYLGHRSIASTVGYIDMDSHEEKANAIVIGLDISGGEIPNDRPVK